MNSYKIPNEEWSDTTNTSPALKMTWLMLRVAVMHKQSKLTITREGKKKLRVLTDDNPAMPPPRHLFLMITNILRQLGHRAQRYPHPVFEVTYHEEGRCATCVVNIHHESPDESHKQFREIFQELSRKERQENADWWKAKKQEKKIKKLSALTFTVTGFLLASVFYLLLFLLTKSTSE